MNIHIGKMIRQHLEEVGMTKSEFARRIKTSPQNIYGIFKRKSCDTELLQAISKVLNFDFFQYYSSAALTIDGKSVTAATIKAQLDQANAELDQLRKENSYLKEIRELYGRKSQK